MPRYVTLLEETQDQAQAILASYDVFGELGLTPVEQDSFYALLLKGLLVSGRQFDPRALNLAAWIQEEALDHFNQLALHYGRSAHLPALFRWHYAFLPVIGPVMEALTGGLAHRQVAAALTRARARAALDTRRREAKRLLSTRP